MTKPILISAGLLLGILTTLGWAFELPLLDGTINVGQLLSDAALYGALAGMLVGLVASRAARSFLGKFQITASSILLCTALVTLLAHYTNRSFGTASEEVTALKVKEVTKSWSGRGVSREQLLSPPDGYYIFFESPSGLIRLFQEGAEAPDIGPSRQLPVVTNEGYWGYPRYRLPTADERADYLLNE